MTELVEFSIYREILWISNESTNAVHFCIVTMIKFPKQQTFKLKFKKSKLKYLHI